MSSSTARPVKGAFKLPTSVLAPLVLVGFAAYVLAPAVGPDIGERLGLSVDSMLSIAKITGAALVVLYWLVCAHITLSPVHPARGDQPPMAVLRPSLKAAPWARPRLATFSERLSSNASRMRGRTDSYSTVRTKLNEVYETDPELALELYREWAESRGVPSVPVVTKAGVAGRMIKAGWSAAFASRSLHWVHEAALLIKAVIAKITKPVMAPPRVLGTRLAFIARPWGGARMQRLAFRQRQPRGAFVIDLAPILVLAAVFSLSMGVAKIIVNLGG